MKKKIIEDNSKHTIILYLNYLGDKRILLQTII